MKQCSKCKEILHVSNFTRDIQKKDKLRPSCKKCNSRTKLKEVLSQDYKRCTSCKKVKLKKYFHKDSTKKDGYYSSCKSCRGTKRPIVYGRKYLDSAGYVRLTGESEREHRLIMQRIIGRKLKTDEHVHHIDGNKTNNKPSNLQIISASEHHKEHYHEIKHKFKSNYERIKKCVVCNNEYITKSHRSKYCSGKCLRLTRKEYHKNWCIANKLKK